MNKYIQGFSKIIFLLAVFIYASLSAQETMSITPLKVACIGNSITYGAGIENRETNSYPAALGRLLGDKYEVKNFGVSGRTALRKGDYPYWNEKTYQEALDFKPDIVIIKLGTNDTKPQNWKFKNEFEKDYTDLIDSFANLSSHPKIFICRPVPAFHVKWGIRDSIIVKDVIPVLEKIGKEKKIKVIDLYKPFVGKSNYFPDGIHPNAEGAALMAKIIFKIITGAKEYSLLSPDKKLEMSVFVSDEIKYSLSRFGKSIVEPSQISMTLVGENILGINPKIKNESRRAVNEILKPVVKQKYETITDNFNELTLSFENNYSLVFKAYNDGAAYRFQTSFSKQITVESEQVEFNFNKNYKIWFPEESKLMTHYEQNYLKINLSEITAKRFSLIPALVELDNNVKLAITEADLEDYCGFYLTGSDKPFELVGMFPKYPAKDTVCNDRDIYVTKWEKFLAKTAGTRNFPWRVMVVSEKDGDLIESTMIYKLAKPSDPKIDFSWVKPGKVAWDWWNGNNIYGVDFRAGVNTATYKYYIDFAAKFGIEYIILDEGWYKVGDLLTPNPDMDIPELVRYGKEKNVGIIPWAIWKTLDDQFEPAMEMFSKLGVKGIKIDFMQRDDQPVVNYYYKVAREAAKRNFLIDFHGAYKPTGLYRTFPNVITNEGVKGLEHSRWSKSITPDYCVTLPFIRMLAGPMDFTPGAMVNSTQRTFRDIFDTPMSQGTRCQQLAMYVVYESPLQMLADNPVHYYREQECMEFLSAVPSVWDDTKVLDAKVSEYVLMARRNGAKWYVGAMTNWTPRDMIIDFSFLNDSEYKITFWQDGINADRNAVDYKKISQTINRNTKLNIHLAPGGGWAGIISK